MTNKEKLIYLAGIVDGEGHFYMPMHRNGRGERRPQARIVVVNTDKPLIDWIKANFGGYIYQIKRLRPHYKQAYRWQLMGKEAVLLGQNLASHVIVKREQIKRILPDVAK